MDTEHTEYTEHTASAGDVAGAVVPYLASGRRVETMKLHALLYLVQGFAAERARVMAGGMYVP